MSMIYVVVETDAGNIRIEADVDVNQQVAYPGGVNEIIQRCSNAAQSYHDDLGRQVLNGDIIE